MYKVVVCTKLITDPMINVYTELIIAFIDQEQILSPSQKLKNVEINGNGMGKFISGPREVGNDCFGSSSEEAEFEADGSDSAVEADGLDAVVEADGCDAAVEGDSSDGVASDGGDGGDEGDGYYEYAENLGSDADEGEDADCVDHSSEEKDASSTELSDEEGVLTNSNKVDEEDVIRSDEDREPVENCYEGEECVESSISSGRSNWPIYHSYNQNRNMKANMIVSHNALHSPVFHSFLLQECI